MKYFSTALIPLALIAGFFLLIGLKGILTKRPFLLPAYYFYSIMLLGLLLTIIPKVELIIKSDRVSLEMLPVFSILMFMTLATVLWQQRRGYSAFGVTNESFQAALHSALVKLGLIYKESDSRIELSSLGADIQASVQSWSGTGQLNVKQRGHKQTLGTIARSMNEYFRTTPETATLKPFIINILVGMLGIVLIVYMEIIR